MKKANEQKNSVENITEVEVTRLSKQEVERVAEEK